MRERPILFSGPMVLAILDGRKTQTRRVVKNPESITAIRDAAHLCPYGTPGDRLWVRETWRAWERDSDCLDHIWYRADNTKIAIPNLRATGDFVVGKFDKWWPSIFMPRWASRITLEITGVRAQRLRDITEDDALAEGILKEHPGGPSEAAAYRYPGKANWLGGYTARSAFAELWTVINGNRPGCAWADNPFVWAISFKAAHLPVPTASDISAQIDVSSDLDS